MTLRFVRSPAMPCWWFRLNGSDRAWALSGAGVLAVIAVAGAFVWHWQGVHISDVLRSQEVVQHESASAEARADAVGGVPTPASWWSRLSGERERLAASDRFSASATTLATEFNVRLVRMTFATPSQAAGAPYQSVDVRVEARGSYPNLKSWLAQLLARHPMALALKGLELRRTELEATQPEVEASIDMRLFEPVAGSPR